MSRQLTGTRKQLDNGKWKVSVPVERGSKKRRTATFDDERSAESWQTACIEALLIDGPLPDAAGFKTTVARRRYTPLTRDVGVRTYADAWFHRHYIVNERAGGLRTNGVRADINNHIVDYFDAIGVTRLDEVTPESTTDFANYLAGWPLEYYQATSSKRDPLAESTAGNVLSLLKRILEAAAHDGVLDRSPYSEVKARPRPGEPKKSQKPDEREPVTLERMVRIAAHLAPIHQLAVWMMRLLGLRISETFGPRVRHVVDEDGVMTLIVKEQGGSSMLVRDNDAGGFVRATQSADLKNGNSYRALFVPECLAEIIRIVIDTYHTDPETGEVDGDARLIPGVQQANVSGAHNLRERLNKAAAAAGVLDANIEERLKPHHLRASIATDNKLRDETSEALQQRWLGHRAGSTVLLRDYLLDDPAAKGLFVIRDAIEADVRERIGDLMVPTVVTNQWGYSNPQYERDVYSESVLVACGWRTTRGDGDWLSSGKVAALLGIHPSKARERMADGRIPATQRQWGSRECWFARPDDVEAYLAETASGTTVDELADRLGLSYHQAYQELKRLKLVSHRPTGRRLKLTDKQVRVVEQEQQRISSLHRRAVRVTEAARILQKCERTVRCYLATDALETDPETDSSGARFVTRASLAQALEKRVPQPVAPDVDTMSFADVVALTDLGRRQLRDLICAGHLETIKTGREAAITVTSLRTWAIGFRPDLLPKLKSGGRSSD